MLSDFVLSSADTPNKVTVLSLTLMCSLGMRIVNVHWCRNSDGFITLITFWTWNCFVSESITGYRPADKDQKQFPTVLPYSRRALRAKHKRLLMLKEGRSQSLDSYEPEEDKETLYEKQTKAHSWSYMSQWDHQYLGIGKNHSISSDLMKFSLNVFTEFSEFSDKMFVKRVIQTCSLLCKRPRCYHSARNSCFIDLSDSLNSLNLEKTPITTKYFWAHPRELKTQKLIFHSNFALVTKVLRGESASYDWLVAV